MADTVESPIPFRPNNFRWVPSWIGTAKKWYECEDGFAAKARIAEDYKEIEIGRFFASEVLAKDARNHCVPIYSALQVPHDAGITIVVMPFLRSYDEPSLQTIGEAVDFFGQLFEVVSSPTPSVTYH
ncbi:hypothetical protein PHLCEN_2v11447 [Hermanssonia centrifuga]|uniref:Uncharacterized protein n=1 Tax=Hermanssonia centrifuga TaxID=98765 RepID=A0A2R6NJY1_9APHY|nr:hypothetical protein PHLCEN_2v11447 [Hermanssonia centrifuga]